LNFSYQLKKVEYIEINRAAQGSDPLSRKTPSHCLQSENGTQRDNTPTTGNLTV